MIIKNCSSGISGGVMEVDCIARFFFFNVLHVYVQSFRQLFPLVIKYSDITAFFTAVVGYIGCNDISKILLCFYKYRKNTVLYSLLKEKK